MNSIYEISCPALSGLKILGEHSSWGSRHHFVVRSPQAIDLTFPSERFASIFHTAACRGDKAMGVCQGEEAKLRPLGEPGVHTPGEVKNLIRPCHAIKFVFRKGQVFVVFGTILVGNDMG
jgi:hypothetical protein